MITVYEGGVSVLLNTIGLTIASNQAAVICDEGGLVTNTQTVARTANNGNGGVVSFLPGKVYITVSGGGIQRGIDAVAPEGALIGTGGTGSS